MRIPYGSTKPEKTQWKEEQDVPGIEVDCVAGLLVGFQGALRSSRRSRRCKLTPLPS